MNKLKTNYENAVAAYIAKFEKKQELDLEHWVEFGEIACFGDVFFFNFSDIRLDIDNNIEKGLIIKYTYDSIDHDPKRMNYKSYTMGLRFEQIK